MGKLHELLAVEADLEGAAKRITEEAIQTFDKRADHFLATQNKLTMFDEGRQNENTEVRKDMVTTVYDKLDHVEEHVSRFYDAVYQKEMTNQAAKADIVVDGATLLTGVPATCLLGLESKLKELRKVYEAIPTLAPGTKWEEASDFGKGVYRAAYPEVKMRTQQTIMHKVLYEATDKHPAQIEKWNEQIPVGKYTVTTQCSMLTPAKKSALIGKVDRLIQACKQARQRANTQEVVNGEIGKVLFNYINS